MAGIAQMIRANGGGTFDARTLDTVAPRSGYAVGVEFGTAITLPAEAEEIDVVLALESIGQRYGCSAVGAWIDGGKMHIDPIEIVEHLADAVEIATEYGQAAVYEFATGESLEVRA